MRPITLFLIVLCVWFYSIELIDGGDRVCAAHGFVAARPSVETAVRSMFLHDPSSLTHLAGNMAFLLVFGTLVERAVGSLRFLALYVASGFVGAAFHLLVAAGSSVPLVGASGAIFGVLAACAMIHPRSLAFTAVYFLFNLVGLFFPEVMPGVSVGCHIGGFVCGFVMMRFAFAGKLEEVTA